MRTEPQDCLRWVHSGSAETEGNPEEVGGEEAGADQEGPPRSDLLQRRSEGGVSGVHPRHSGNWVGTPGLRQNEVRWKISKSITLSKPQKRGNIPKSQSMWNWQIFPDFLFLLNWPLFRATKNSDEKIDPDQLYNSLKAILTSCRNHQSSWPFLNPVDRKAVPDYYDHIKFPIDLKTMSERLKANYYVNKRLFIADMKRMLTNCKAYNAPETEYYKSANLLDKFFQNKLKDHGLVEKV